MFNFTYNLAIAIGINQYQNGIAKWPGNWRTMLKVAFNRLKHHPVLTDPKSDEEKSAARTCLRYGTMFHQ